MPAPTIIQGPSLYLPPRYGIACTEEGKDGNFYPGHHAVFIEVVVANVAINEGEIAQWYTSSPGTVQQRADDARMPAGIALDDGSVGDTIRLAIGGVGVDVQQNGTDRGTLGDYMQCGDSATYYYMAKYGFGNFQLGMTVSYAGSSYASGWVRVHLNMSSR